VKCSVLYLGARVADPVEITVSEMGIAGWLKGPEKKR